MITAIRAIQDIALLFLVVLVFVSFGSGLLCGVVAALVATSTLRVCHLFNTDVLDTRHKK